jgi:drug/metabolite transporter (DMT)-like permease
VSQTQLLQPFLSMMFSIPILGEQVDVLTLGFGMAIVGTVFLSRKMPVHAQA